jgi:hypothetical protein
MTKKLIFPNFFWSETFISGLKKLLGKIFLKFYNFSILYPFNSKWMDSYLGGYKKDKDPTDPDTEISFSVQN